MSKVTHPDVTWAVLTHPTGEVLTAKARSPGLYLGLLGVPPGFARQDAEGWLYDVAGVAHESSAARPAARPIPALLDHAMTGLLFSHGELWDQPGLPSPCSFAFAEGRGEVGFGWVGEAKVSVWVDGQAHDTGWVTLRDDRGRQGRAWSIPSDHDVQVRISWSHSIHDPAAGGAEVEAAWNALGGPEPVGLLQYDTLDSEAESSVSLPDEVAPVASHDAAPDLPLDAAPELPPVEDEVSAGRDSAPGDEPLPAADGAHATPEWVVEYEAEARRSSPGIAGWLRNAVGWLIGRHAKPSEPAAAATTLESNHANEIAPLAEMIPPTPETDTSTPDVGEGAPPVVTLRPEDSVLIPPSPEPVELATRAVLWAEADDPNIVDLPGSAPAVPAPASRQTQAELKITDVSLDEPATLAGSGPAPPPLDGLLPLAGAKAAPRAVDATAPTGAAVPGSVHAPPVAVPPQRPAWPSAQELARPRWLPGHRHALWIALVGALFAGGWLVGAVQDDGRPQDAGRRGALGQALHAVGLGGPRFVVQVNSRPPGAWIAVDGENFTLRTPAAIEVAPGEHTIGLSFTEFGGASFPVRGRKGERVPLDATLWGALDVISPHEIGVIAVSVDGVARGLAPFRVDSLTPGVHEVRFSGANVVPWGQTVDIRVGETREVLARAVQSPSSGVLQVEASLTDEQGTQPLKGAQVWIDAELRGTTPLMVDLPRGPHSVRLVHKGQEAPIQVIELPGGNQRFAVFELGFDREVPRLALDIPARIPRDRPAVLSATVVGIAAADVREMWLHVRMAEGAWRRYGMTVLKAPAGAAGVATFPTAAFDAQGRARYYVSAHSGQGDETFTEIRTILLESAPPTGR